MTGDKILECSNPDVINGNLFCDGNCYSCVYGYYGGEIETRPVIVPAFDSNGKDTGKKWMLCLDTERDCEYQRFVGDGAFTVCGYEKCIEIKKCIWK